MDWRYLQGEGTWITQVFVVVFTALLADFIQRRVLYHFAKRLAKTATVWDDALLESLRRRESAYGNGEDRFLVFFKLIKELPLAGDGSKLPSFTASGTK